MITRVMRSKKSRGNLIKMQIKESIRDIRSYRIIIGFYYAYLHPEERGRRDQKWRIMCTDALPVLGGPR